MGGRRWEAGDGRGLDDLRYEAFGVGLRFVAIMSRSLASRFGVRHDGGDMTQGRGPDRSA